MGLTHYCNVMKLKRQWYQFPSEIGVYCQTILKYVQWDQSYKIVTYCTYRFLRPRLFWTSESVDVLILKFCARNKQLIAYIDIHPNLTFTSQANTELIILFYFVTLRQRQLVPTGFHRKKLEMVHNWIDATEFYLPFQHYSHCYVYVGLGMGRYSFNVRIFIIRFCYSVYNIETND